MSLKLSFVLAASLFAIYPCLALADSKTDIEAYTKAFEEGNVNEGDKLLLVALENAKKSLEPGNPYLMKIAYDTALNYVISDRFDKGQEVAKILSDGQKQNKDVLKGANIDEFNLVMATLNISPLSKNVTNHKYINELEAALEKFETSNPDDELLLNSYAVLCQSLSSAALWKRLAVNADKLIMLSERFSKTKSRNAQYEFLGLFLRGQGRFASALSNHNLSGIGTIKGFENSPYWEASIADIEKALHIYGEPKTVDDPNYNAISIWKELIIAGAMTKGSKIKEGAIEEIYSKLALPSNNAKEALAKPQCEGLVQSGIKFKNVTALNFKYSFSAARVIFDIDENSMPINIRVVGSIPRKDVAEAVVSDLKRASPVVKPNTPSECLKDYVVTIRFVTD